MFRLGGEAAGDFAKEDERDIQLPGEIVANDDRSQGCLRQKATVRPQGTELDGKAPPRRIRAAPHDFCLVTGGKRPVLRELLLTRIFG
jgi:hypothetical protein